MQKFFICTDGVAKGPYQLEDLQNRGLDEKDLIWSMDLGSRYASEIKELKGYFKKNNHEPSFQYQTPSAKDGSSIIKNVVLFSLLFVLAGLIIYYFTTY